MMGQIIGTLLGIAILFVAIYAIVAVLDLIKDGKVWWYDNSVMTLGLLAIVLFGMVLELFIGYTLSLIAQLALVFTLSARHKKKRREREAVDKNKK